MAHRSNLISSGAVIAALALATGARADNPKRAAQALVTQGMRLIEHRQYDEALAKLRAAYALYDSPKILLDIGSTLRDMGRFAEAANVYAQYLADGGAEARRKAEVQRLLHQLDAKLTVLEVDVTPMAADVAIDDGPWVPVGGRMEARVAPGMHLVRARGAGLAPQERRVDGHPGAHQGVAIALRPAEPPARPPIASVPPPAPAPEPQPPPVVVTARANRVPPRVAAAEPLPPVEPPPPAPAPPDDVVVTAAARPRPLVPAPAGLEVASRIDGHFRGAAASVGLLVDTSRVETEVAAIVSHDAERVVPGAYAGVRIHAGQRVRLFVGGGSPLIWSAGEARFAIRGSAGLEWFFDAHLGLLAELGVEHFFNPQATYEATLFVPLVGLQGRL